MEYEFYVENNEWPILWQNGLQLIKKNIPIWLWYSLKHERTDIFVKMHIILGLLQFWVAHGSVCSGILLQIRMSQTELNSTYEIMI